MLDSDDAQFDKDGVSNLLFGAIGAPEQMAEVSLLVPRIFLKENYPGKKVSFAGSVPEQDSGKGRVTLHDYKLYMDTCATYHSAFMEWMLDNVHILNTVLCGNCNTCVTSTNVKGTYGCGNSG